MTERTLRDFRPHVWVQPRPVESAELYRDATTTNIAHPDSFARIYAHHRASTLQLARRLCQDDQLSEDVVQEVFVRFWRRPDRFDPDRGSLGSFLLMECRGRAIDAIRQEAAREQRHLRHERNRPSDARKDIAEETVHRAAHDSVRCAVDELPAELREPLVLAFFGGLTYVDVARTLRLPEGTVKTRLRRALRRLAANPTLAAMR